MFIKKKKIDVFTNWLWTITKPGVGYVPDV